MDGQASPVTWRTIIKIIQGLFVENNDLANKIFQSLKERECKQKIISKYIQCILLINVITNFWLYINHKNVFSHH